MSYFLTFGGPDVALPTPHPQFWACAPLHHGLEPAEAEISPVSCQGLEPAEAEVLATPQVAQGPATLCLYVAIPLFFLALWTFSREGGWQSYLLCPASKSSSVVEKRVPSADTLKFFEGEMRKYCKTKESQMRVSTPSGTFAHVMSGTLGLHDAANGSGRCLRRPGC